MTLAENISSVEMHNFCVGNNEKKCFSLYLNMEILLGNEIIVFPLFLNWDCV